MKKIFLWLVLSMLLSVWWITQIQADDGSDTGPAWWSTIHREWRETNTQCPLFLYACQDGSCEKEESACVWGTNVARESCNTCDDDCDGDIWQKANGVDEDCDDTCPVAHPEGSRLDDDDDGDSILTVESVQQAISPCPWFMCADGTCVDDRTACEMVVSCPVDTPVLCPSGACSAWVDACVYGELDQETQQELLQRVKKIIWTKATGVNGHITPLKAMLKEIVNPHDAYQDGDDPVLRKRPGRTKYNDITLKKAAALYQMIIYLEYNEFYSDVCEGVSCGDGTCLGDAELCGEL